MIAEHVALFLGICFGMAEFVRELAIAFAVSLGMVAGGALAGALVVLLFGGLPMETMVSLAQRLKLWAIVAALGGALVTLQMLETGLVQGEITKLLRQLILLGAAFAGAHLGSVLVAAAAGRG